MNVLERNNVQVIGSGEKTLVFGHGFGCDQTMWRYITHAFKQDYRIVLFDYVGSGNSDLSFYDFQKYASLNGYVEDLYEVLTFLELKEVIFIGHSISSMIGMLTAIKYPELFHKMIMIGPSPRYLNDSDGYYGGFDEPDILELLEMMEMNFVGWATSMAPKVADKEESPLVVKEVETSFQSNDPAVSRQFAEVTFFSDHRGELSDLDIPVLIIQCSEDSIVPIEVGEYLHRHLKHSNLQILEVKGHYPHLSHPEETAQLIYDFLLD